MSYETMNSGDICRMKPREARVLLKALYDDYGNCFCEDDFNCAFGQLLVREPTGEFVSLIGGGWLQPVKHRSGKLGYYQLSEQARTVSASRVLARISRERVDALLAEVVAMARQQNQEGFWLESVKSITLFGSCLDESKPDYGNVNLCVVLEQRGPREEIWKKTVAGHKDGHWPRPEAHDYYFTAQARQLKQLASLRQHVLFDSPAIPFGKLAPTVIYEASAETLAEAVRLHEKYYRDQAERGLKGAVRLFGELPEDEAARKSMAEVALMVERTSSLIATVKPGPMARFAARALVNFAEKEAGYSKPVGPGSYGFELEHHVFSGRADRLAKKLAALPPDGSVELDMVDLKVYCRAIEQTFGQATAKLDKAGQEFLKKPFQSSLNSRDIKMAQKTATLACYHLEKLVGKYLPQSKKALKAIAGR